MSVFVVSMPSSANSDLSRESGVRIPVAGGGTEKLNLLFKHKRRDDVREFFARAPDDHADVFAGIRIMEHAALAEMNGG